MQLNSAQRRRRWQWLIVAAGVLVLAGMLAVNLIRHDPEQARVDDLSTRLSQRGVDNEPSPAEREELRKEFDQLSPKARDEVFRAVARQRLDHLRQELSGLTAPERAQKVRQAVTEMQRHRNELTAREREEMHARLNSEEGQKLVKRMLDFYAQELTAKERAEMDPLVHEWLNQVNELAK